MADTFTRVKSLINDDLEFTYVDETGAEIDVVLKAANLINVDRGVIASRHTELMAILGRIETHLKLITGEDSAR